MKVDVMRERLIEAVTLAADEKIIQQFNLTTLEISRSEVLTLEDIQELVRHAESEMGGAEENDPAEALLDAMIDRTEMALNAMKQMKKKPADGEAKEAA